MEQKFEPNKCKYASLLGVALSVSFLLLLIPRTSHSVNNLHASNIHQIIQVPSFNETSDGNKQHCRNCLQGKVLVTVAKGYICSQARLGNKLCMMSAAIGAAAAKNMTFVLIEPSKSCRWIYRLQELFITLQKTTPLVSIQEVNSWRSVHESGVFKYTNIPNNRNVSLTGFRQTWKYFSSKQQQEAVRKTFEFTEKYKKHADKILSNAKNSFSHVQQPIMVGVHMRLGDIVTIKNGKRLATQEYYDRAFNVVQSYFKGSNSLIFVAATDSPHLAKKMLKDASKKYNIFWAGGTDLEDFATLTKCNHSIISGGTFSFWTAWLAGGQTFYNANVSIPNTSFDNRYIEENFNLPDWIPVSWI